MEKILAAVVAAVTLSLVGLMPPVVPQPWAGGGLEPAGQSVPCHGQSAKRCPGPRHPKVSTPELRKPVRPGYRHRI